MKHFLFKSSLTFRFLVFFGLGGFWAQGQNAAQMYAIVDSVDQNRLATDIKTLAEFGTRHTLSDTVSDVRGIGAARRWIKAEFEKISTECGGCLEVFYQKSLVKKGTNQRIFKCLNFFTFKEV